MILFQAPASLGLRNVSARPCQKQELMMMMMTVGLPCDEANINSALSLALRAQLQGPALPGPLSDQIHCRLDQLDQIPGAQGHP